MIQTTPSLTLNTLEDHMVLVEGGTFEMGSENGRGNSKPIHPVSLDSFYLCRYQVSQSLWEEVMDDNPKPAAFPHPSRPVEKVSWYDAVDFCNRLSEKLGLHPYYEIDRDRQDPNNTSSFDKLKWTVTTHPGANGYRLPTEAEWEYAARGGKYARELEYAGSNNRKEVAWYGDNSHNMSQSTELRRPNALGLYDLAGNLYEWCQDWYDTNYYQTCAAKGTVSNPTGPPKGSSRGVRGGSWYTIVVDTLRPSYRDNSLPDNRYNFIGFRLSRYVFYP